MNTEQNQLFLGKETSKLFSSTTAFQSEKGKKEHNAVIIVPCQHFSESALWWVFHLHCEVWTWKRFCAFFFLCWFAIKPQAVTKSGLVMCSYFSNKDKAFVCGQYGGETSGRTRSHKQGLRLCLCDCTLQAVVRKAEQTSLDECAGKHLWHRGTKALLALCTSHDCSLRRASWL